MKHCLVCEIFLKNLLHNSTYQTLHLQQQLYTNVFVHNIDCTRYLLLLTTLWREEGKLKTTRAFLYLINFDTMSKCLQNIVTLKKSSTRSLRPLYWCVCPGSFTIVNKKCSRRWQNHGHSKVSTPVKATEAIIQLRFHKTTHHHTSHFFDTSCGKNRARAENFWLHLLQWLFVWYSNISLE